MAFVVRKIQLLLLILMPIAFLLQQQSVYLFALGYFNSPSFWHRVFRPPSQFAEFFSSTSSRKSRKSTGSRRLTTYKKMMRTDTGGGEVLLDENDALLLVSNNASNSPSDKGGGEAAAALPPSVARGNTCTLASDYWIECSINYNDEDNVINYNDEDNVINKYYTWSLVPLSRIVPDLEPEFQQSNGATAWAALYKRYSNNNDDKSATTDVETTATTALTLQSRISRHDNSIHVTVVIQENEQNQVIMTDANDPLLIAVLSRVLAQWTMTLEEEKSESSCTTVVAERTIHWPDGTTTILPAVLTNKINKRDDDDDESRQIDQTERKQLLYKNIFNITPQSEIVEMVNHQGLVLGCVPRKLVHQYNLLHRGIGMFVTRDKPIIIPTSCLATKTHTSNSVIQQQQQQPDLYVHQRTSTKRIFPSLYDMFVGGVALAGESSQLTACREVAEELGLQQALLLDNSNNQLSNCIFTCTVCTCYNRCVVDFFTYTMNTTMEHVSWQPEEVAWGDFVPYHIVESAANLSIQRLVNCNAWPGKYPPVSIIQSRQEKVQLAAGSTTKLHNEEWKTWDFVPDGLLVWEAWIQFLEGATKE